jgi:hypothetical protein
VLHSVPAPAEEQRPKKTFPEFVAAVYEDPRVGHETRELLLAIGYAVDLAKREDGVSPLKVARQKLGVEHGRQARYDRLVAADAPRYKPPREAGDWGPGGAPGCQAPRLRPYAYRPRPAASPFDDEAVVRIRPLPTPVVHVDAGHVDPVDYRNEHGICGANSHHRVLEKDPRTGWITAHWFCMRHKEHAGRVSEQVKAQNEQDSPLVRDLGRRLANPRWCAAAPARAPASHRRPGRVAAYAAVSTSAAGFNPTRRSWENAHLNASCSRDSAANRSFSSLISSDTVRGDTSRRAAVARWSLPATMSRMISRCRGVVRTPSTPGPHIMSSARPRTSPFHGSARRHFSSNSATM